MKPKNSDARVNVDNFTDKLIEGLCNYNRYITLYDEINEDTAAEVNKKIKVFNWKDTKLAIILEINSGGGSCIDGLSIIDTILSSSAPIVTVVTGMAASMASLISVIGTHRYITPNAYWMAHPMSSEMRDYLPYMKDHFTFLFELNNRMEAIYKKHTKLIKSDYEKLRNGELWLTSDLCIQKGVADEILKNHIKIAREK